MRFGREAREKFDVKDLISPGMESVISGCERIYKGAPDWIDRDNHIKTVNFAKSVCSETARLTALGIAVHIEGSVRADKIKTVFDEYVFRNLRHWIEYGCAYGTVILKPNGTGVDLFTPDRFIVTDTNGGNITGVIFENQTYSQLQKKYYTRLEYHRFKDKAEGGRQYIITNHCYMGDTPNDTGKPVDIKKTPWSGLSEESAIENVDKPFFGVFRTPQANNVDIDSPYGIPLFAEAVEELCDLDIAYSRNSKEVYDSKRTVLLDSDRILPGFRKFIGSAKGAVKAMELPDYVKCVEGVGDGAMYQEINPSLQTETRLTGINALLSQIGYKCGFSNGYFVFNEKTGMVTATQVEADDRRTIQLIADVREKLEICVKGLVYALDKFEDLYGDTPVGKVETVCDFEELTQNREEDRTRWYSYVIAGKVPFWRYLVMFEGFTEEDAKLIESEAAPREPMLFAGE